jgi:NAD(P)-dependent dehydrogenase (short-subunit alcohol dehydrogenase family)
MRLENKTAIITGAGGLLGRTTAEVYAREGANLVLTDRDPEALAEATKSLPDERTLRLGADVTSVTDTETVASQAVQKFGGVDIFFANAGIEGFSNEISDYSLDVYNDVMDINVKGIMIGLQIILPKMNDGGSIIMTSSIAGLMGSPVNIAYAASKHAVIGLRRSTAIPAGKRGIRVNSLHPGFVESPMLTRLMSQRGDLEEVRAELTSRVKLGRFTDAEEIANAALFLGSDESKGMTDQMLVIDGGVV